MKDSKEGKEVKLDDETTKDNQDAKKEDNGENNDDDAKDEEKEKVVEKKYAIDDEPLRERRKGSIHLKLFFKVAELCLCSSEREIKQDAHCMNLSIVEREVHDELEAKLHGRNDGFKKGQKYAGGDGQGQRKKGQHQNKRESTTPWLTQDSEEKQKLKR